MIINKAMAKTQVNPHLKTFGLGMIAGMRSMSAPALISHYLCRVPADNLAGTPLRYMQNATVATGLKVLAASEIIADKLPGTPDRIAPPVLASRALAGALVGYTLHQANGESKWIGGLLGAMGAVAASYGFFYLRKKLTNSTKIPDTAWAVVEDALMLASGIPLAKTAPTHQ